MIYNFRLIQAFLIINPWLNCDGQTLFYPEIRDHLRVDSLRVVKLKKGAFLYVCVYTNTRFLLNERGVICVIYVSFSNIWRHPFTKVQLIINIDS